MSDEGLEALRKRLGEYIVPYTSDGLGATGSTLEVTAAPDAYRVAVSLGFPIERSASDFEEALREHTAELNLDKELSFSLQWSVESHAVQHGLKPLPGVSNVIAVASGRLTVNDFVCGR